MFHSRETSPETYSDFCPQYAPELDSKLPRWSSWGKELQDHTNVCINFRLTGLNGQDGQFLLPPTLDLTTEECSLVP